MQASPLDIRQKLRQRFASAGLAESQSWEPGPGPDLVFQGDGARVCLVILDHLLWADRRAFMDSIMRASALVGKASRTYIVLPKTAACLTDARVFQDQGIGLFTYDQRNLEEALPAKYFETSTSSSHQPDGGATAQLESELRELRIQFDALERIVRELKNESVSPKEGDSPAEHTQTFVPSAPMRDALPHGGLPTFFAGNPWVEVLSRRGRGDARIAG